MSTVSVSSNVNVSLKKIFVYKYNKYTTTIKLLHESCNRMYSVRKDELENTFLKNVKAFQIIYSGI